jgi:hypothetical protein
MASNGIDRGFGSAGQVGSDTSMLRNEDAAALYKNQSDEIRGHDISVSNLRGECQEAGRVWCDRLRSVRGCWHGARWCEPV